MESCQSIRVPTESGHGRPGDPRARGQIHARYPQAATFTRLLVGEMDIGFGEYRGGAFSYVKMLERKALTHPNTSFMRAS